MAFWRPFEVDDRDTIPTVSELSTNETAEFSGKDLHVQSQRIILNIYECLKNENPVQSDRAIVQRICKLTKISDSTIFRVIKVGTVIDHSIKRKRTNQKFRNIDDAAKEVIRRTVYDLYKKNIVPNLEMIRDKLRDYPDYNYQCLETLRSILLNCGFKHKKINNRMVIMESRRIVERRQEYLHKINEYRESKRNIVYLDETWFDTHDVVQYGWVDESQNCSLNTPCSRGKRIIILHAGGENGFVPNALLLSAKNIKQSSADYHEDMTADLFEKWVSEQLLPNIPPNSVIVMDNASYHSRILNKVPNSNTKKEDILKFMESKNIDVEYKNKVPIKKELLKIIKSYNFKNEYVVDNICTTHGHTLLRLPPYYCIFNPIELIWGTIKKSLRKRNQSPTLSAVVIENIRQVINDLDSGVWKNCVAHVIKEEKEYPILPPVSSIVIEPGKDSTSEDSDA